MKALQQDPEEPAKAEHVCNICGKASEKTICDLCSERIRLEALARKKREEQGNSWAHWE